MQLIFTAVQLLEETRMKGLGLVLTALPEIVLGVTEEDFQSLSFDAQELVIIGPATDELKAIYVLFRWSMEGEGNARFTFDATGRVIGFPESWGDLLAELFDVEARALFGEKIPEDVVMKLTENGMVGYQKMSITIIPVSLSASFGVVGEDRQSISFPGDFPV